MSDWAMLASPSTSQGGRAGVSLQQLQDSGLYVWQRKLDGVRARLTWNGSRVRIVSRHGTELTFAFPEIVHEVKTFAWDQGVAEFTVDGEIILDTPGTTLADVLSRAKLRGQHATFASVRHPARIVAFDLLHTDGLDTIALRIPLHERLRMLREGFDTAPNALSIAATWTDGPGAWQHAVDGQWEGIMAKRKDSTYTPGVRSWSWVKFKQTYTVRAIAYEASGTSGRGVKLAMVDGTVRDVGSVGSGLRAGDHTRLRAAWAAGEYPVMLIDCLGVSTSGRLRQPVFKGFTDEPISAADFTQLDELPVTT